MIIARRRWNGNIYLLSMITPRIMEWYHGSGYEKASKGSSGPYYSSKPSHTVVRAAESNVAVDGGLPFP
jgi:hypothetical protein